LQKSFLQRFTMKIPIPNIIRWYPIASLLLSGIFFAFCTFTYHYLKINYLKVETHIPVTVSGVHHMGSDYLISHFSINREIGDNIAPSGGSGIVCCLMIPKKWFPGLTADVRWEVWHIIRQPDGISVEREELVAIYRAQVPVEPYADTGELYVHFFANGRVRIVVSDFGPEGKQHPIASGDSEASQMATAGKIIESFYTKEELAEIERETSRERAQFGDWR
jgi:hypothetical protein